MRCICWVLIMYILIILIKLLYIHNLHESEIPCDRGNGAQWEIVFANKTQKCASNIPASRADCGVAALSQLFGWQLKKNQFFVSFSFILTKKHRINCPEFLWQFCSVFDLSVHKISKTLAYYFTLNFVVIFLNIAFSHKNTC